VFIVSGDNTSLFSVGDSVDIQLSGDTYLATVIDAADLNLEPSDRLTYLQLNETAFDIKENATGSIRVELARRDNVVYIPSSAVKRADGQEIVYVLDDKNMRTMHKVVTGFSADGKIEIIEGLEPGDLVIIE
jgi:multidrug efflux pump subunit AcrA (membrane-fusion protein)